MDTLPGAQDARGIAIRWDYTEAIAKSAGAESRGRCERLRKARHDWKERELGEKNTTRRIRRRKEKNMSQRNKDKRKKKNNAEESTA